MKNTRQLVYLNKSYDYAQKRDKKCFKPIFLSGKAIEKKIGGHYSRLYVLSIEYFPLKNPKNSSRMAWARIKLRRIWPK